MFFEADFILTLDFMMLELSCRHLLCFLFETKNEINHLVAGKVVCPVSPSPEKESSQRCLPIHGFQWSVSASALISYITYIYIYGNEGQILNETK